MKNKNTIIIILIILLITGSFIFLKNKRADRLVDLIGQTPGPYESVEPVYHLKDLALEQIYLAQAKILYVLWIKEQGQLPDYALSDFKIDGAEVILAKSDASIDQVKDFFTSESSNQAVMVKVIYSIKPIKIERSSWLAGSGVEEAGFVNQKVDYVTIDKIDNVYKIINHSSGLN